jgi:hypothetical protein
MRRSTYKDIVNFLSQVAPEANKGQLYRRTRLMASLIHACIRNGHCRLESLSQVSEGYRAEKKSSLLQQAKRWLSNKWTDWDTFYLPFVQYLIQGVSARGEIILIIDGSQTDAANTTLMLSVLFRGFAIPLAWLVKPGEKGHFPEQMHLDLLRTIAGVCPPGCKVVLLGDGEFDGHALQQLCTDNHWSFVLRTSCDRQIDFNGETARFDSIRTSRRIFFIPDALPLAHAVYWHGKKHVKPLFLLTNFELGQDACDYYRRRFKIETLFKHLKSAGFYLHKTRLKCPYKLSNLIIVVAFAFVISFCMGLFIKQKQSIKTTELIVRKDRLIKICPLAIAQLAISHGCECVMAFFSELSKNFNEVFS